MQSMGSATALARTARGVCAMHKAGTDSTRSCAWVIGAAETCVEGWAFSEARRCPGWRIDPGHQFVWQDIGDRLW